MNTLLENTFLENTLLENTLLENTLLKNTLYALRFTPNMDSAATLSSLKVNLSLLASPRTHLFTCFASHTSILKVWLTDQQTYLLTGVGRDTCVSKEIYFSKCLMHKYSYTNTQLKHGYNCWQYISNTNKYRNIYWYWIYNVI